MLFLRMFLFLKVKSIVIEIIVVGMFVLMVIFVYILRQVLVVFIIIDRRMFRINVFMVYLGRDFFGGIYGLNFMGCIFVVNGILFCILVYKNVLYCQMFFGLMLNLCCSGGFFYCGLMDVIVGNVLYIFQVIFLCL